MSFPMARVAPEKAVFRPALPMGFLPGVNGTHMGKMTYGEQLKHPNWQKRRLQMLEAAGWACRCCESKEVTLHVHHKKYVKGRMAWEYSDSELEVLCEPCHQEEHAAQSMLQTVIGNTEIHGYAGTLRVHVIAAGLVAGYVSEMPGGTIDDDTIDLVVAESEPFFNIGMVAARINITSRDERREIAEILLRSIDGADGLPAGEVEALLRNWAQAA